MGIPDGKQQITVILQKSQIERIEKLGSKYYNRQHFVTYAIERLLEHEYSFEVRVPSDIKKEIALSDEADLND